MSAITATLATIIIAACWVVLSVAAAIDVLIERIRHERKTM